MILNIKKLKIMENISDEIKKMNDKELELFVRKRLEFDYHIYDSLLHDCDSNKRPHHRFDMTGYGDECGSCNIHNTMFIVCLLLHELRLLNRLAKGVISPFQKRHKSVAKALRKRHETEIRNMDLFCGGALSLVHTCT